MATTRQAADAVAPIACRGFADEGDTELPEGKGAGLPDADPGPFRHAHRTRDRIVAPVPTEQRQFGRAKNIRQKNFPKADRTADRGQPPCINQCVIFSDESGR